jgi:hypothetical protein
MRVTIHSQPIYGGSAIALFAFQLVAILKNEYKNKKINGTVKGL